MKAINSVVGLRRLSGIKGRLVSLSPTSAADNELTWLMLVSTVTVAVWFAQCLPVALAFISPTCSLSKGLPARLRCEHLFWRRGTGRPRGCRDVVELLLELDIRRRPLIRALSWSSLLISVDFSFGLFFEP